MRIQDRYLAALLVAGSAAPMAGWAHSEGVEAADPATPPAVLTFDGAAGRYTAIDAAPRDWRALFAGDATAGRRTETEAADGAHRHTGHAGPAQRTPATRQQ